MCEACRQSLGASTPLSPLTTNPQASDYLINSALFDRASRLEHFEESVIDNDTPGNKARIRESQGFPNLRFEVFIANLLQAAMTALLSAS